MFIGERSDWKPDSPTCRAILSVRRDFVGVLCHNDSPTELWFCLTVSVAGRADVLLLAASAAEDKIRDLPAEHGVRGRLVRTNPARQTLEGLTKSGLHGQN